MNDLMNETDPTNVSKSNEFVFERNLKIKLRFLINLSI